MDRETFARRFHEAATASRECALRFVEERLPQDIRFRLRLNSSYDGNPLHADERVYPEDGEKERGRALRACSAEEVVDVLWRDGLVPEWINLNVVGETPTATLVEVASCGRFTANEGLLYHKQEGWQPFHVLGPALPVG